MLQTRQDVTTLAGLLNGIDQYGSLVRDLAAVILPQHPGFESVWDVTNRVYDRCCNNRTAMISRRRTYQAEEMALSA